MVYECFVWQHRTKTVQCGSRKMNSDSQGWTLYLNSTTLRNIKRSSPWKVSMKCIYVSGAIFLWHKVYLIWSKSEGILMKDRSISDVHRLSELSIGCRRTLVPGSLRILQMIRSSFNLPNSSLIFPNLPKASQIYLILLKSSQFCPNHPNSS